jgi:transaldolase
MRKVLTLSASCDHGSWYLPLKLKETLKMKIFLDTANIDQIREVHSMGILDGVTTNPSLMAKEGKDFEATIKEICEIVQGPVNAEVLSADHEGQMKEAVEYAAWSEHVIVKVPMTLDGIKTVAACAAKGIRTNVTLIFSANQALIAARAGASYVSPFLGRLDDIGSEGLDLVQDIVEIFANYPELIQTEVIAASIRHPMHVTECARMGADICTLPKKVVLQMLKHPLTDIGIEKFNADWAAAQGAKEA